MAWPISVQNVMPEISRFYGIVIRMYFGDHFPPHFHAEHGSQEARVAIATGELIDGTLPIHAKRRVRRWTRLHRKDLYANWRRGRTTRPPRRIDPLR